MGRPPSSGGIQNVAPGTSPTKTTKKAHLNSSHKRAGSTAVKALHGSAAREASPAPGSNYSSDELDLNDIEDDK